MYFPRWE